MNRWSYRRDRNNIDFGMRLERGKQRQNGIFCNSALALHDIVKHHPANVLRRAFCRKNREEVHPEILDCAAQLFFHTAGKSDIRSGLLDRFPRARGVHAVRRQCSFDLAYLVHHLEFVLTAQHSDFIFGRSFVFSTFCFYTLLTPLPSMALYLLTKLWIILRFSLFCLERILTD